jgi:hypothetical protein
MLKKLNARRMGGWMVVEKLWKTSAGNNFNAKKLLKKPKNTADST